MKIDKLIEKQMEIIASGQKRYDACDNDPSYLAQHCSILETLANAKSRLVLASTT